MGRVEKNHPLYLPFSSAFYAPSHIRAKYATTGVGSDRRALHGSTQGPGPTDQVTTDVTTDVAPEIGAFLKVVQEEMLRPALQAAMGLKNAEQFRKTYLVPSFSEVEKPFLEQLATLGWTVIDQGGGVPRDAGPSLRAVIERNGGISIPRESPANG